jgi:hypothetical protein
MSGRNEIFLRSEKDIHIGNIDPSRRRYRLGGGRPFWQRATDECRKIEVFIRIYR